MSYSMHSSTQGYSNHPTDVYNTRAYTSHLMGPNAMAPNYPTGYALRDDPYSSPGLQYSSNGMPLQSPPISGVAGSHFSGGGGGSLVNSPPSSSSLIPSHHTYPSSMNHFGHQQDLYNSCIGPRNNNSYPGPPPPNATSNVVSRHSMNSSKSYWSCDSTMTQQQSPIPPPNHCYPSPSNTSSMNATQPHKSNWSRSPNVINSPSTTPSPIPCPSTPHPSAAFVGGVGSSPHHHSEPNQHGKQGPQPYNGGQMMVNSNQTNSGPNAIVNCNNNNGNSNSGNNPLQSLQKMVQIDSHVGASAVAGDLVVGRPSQYDNSSTTTQVPMVNQPPPSQHSAQMNTQHGLSGGLVDNTDANNNNYPTYYNLDQNRLCATPHSSQQTSYPPTPHQMSAQQSSTVSFSSMATTTPNTTTNKSSHSPDKSQKTSDNSANNDSSDMSTTRSNNSIRFQNKINKNNSSCSTDTCSNESPSNKPLVSNIPESIMHADQTHDSMNSFRGSETTANSRDSIKSSDSDAVSSYTVSQCSTPNATTNTWNKSSNGANQTNDFQSNNFSPNSQSKTWWSENSMPSNNRSFTPMAEQYSSANYEMSSNRHQSMGNHSWSQQVNSGQSMSSHHLIGSSGGYGHHHHHHPDGVIKKKRGRPFGSKNRRSLEAAAQLMDPKRKRKSILIDIGINTNLSFDVQASWNHDDSVMTFSTSPPINNVQQQQQNSNSTTTTTIGRRNKNNKHNGPVIRIDKSCYESSINNSTKYSIVNNSLFDDDDDMKPNKQTKLSNDQQQRSMKNNNSFSKKSFFNNTNQTNNGTKNWFCILCHKGPHYKGLGDLYGPYFISLESTKLISDLFDINNGESNNQTSNDDVIKEENNVESSTTTLVPERRSLRKRINPNETNSTTTTTTNNNDDGKNKNSANNSHLDCKNESTNNQQKTTELEVWIHEDCIVWSNNVYLEGTKIRNLEPAIIESFENICTKCKLPGATLGCIYKNCTVSPLHYLCAKEKDCDLDEEKFILSCSKHKKRRIMSTTINPTTTTTANNKDNNNEMVNNNDNNTTTKTKTQDAQVTDSSGENK